MRLITPGQEFVWGDCQIPDSYHEVGGERMRSEEIKPIPPEGWQFPVKRARLRERLERVGENPERLVGCYVWLSTANDPTNDAVPHNTPGVRIHQLENPALYSKGKIVRATRWTR